LLRLRAALTHPMLVLRLRGSNHPWAQTHFLSAEQMGVGPHFGQLKIEEPTGPQEAFASHKWLGVPP